MTTLDLYQTFKEKVPSLIEVNKVTNLVFLRFGSFAEAQFAYEYLNPSYTCCIFPE